MVPILGAFEHILEWRQQKAFKSKVHIITRGFWHAGYVGQCFFTRYLRDIPFTFTTVTSRLGENGPSPAGVYAGLQPHRLPDPFEWWSVDLRHTPVLPIHRPLQSPGPVSVWVCRLVVSEVYFWFMLWGGGFGMIGAGGGTESGWSFVGEALK